MSFLQVCFEGMGWLQNLVQADENELRHFLWLISRDTNVKVSALSPPILLMLLLLLILPLRALLLLLFCFCKLFTQRRLLARILKSLSYFPSNLLCSWSTLCWVSDMIFHTMSPPPLLPFLPLSSCWYFSFWTWLLGVHIFKMVWRGVLWSNVFPATDLLVASDNMQMIHWFHSLPATVYLA